MQCASGFRIRCYCGAFTARTATAAVAASVGSSQALQKPFSDTIARCEVAIFPPLHLQNDTTAIAGTAAVRAGEVEAWFATNEVPTTNPATVATTTTREEKHTQTAPLASDDADDFQRPHVCAQHTKAKFGAFHATVSTAITCAVGPIVQVVSHHCHQPAAATHRRRRVKWWGHAWSILVA